ncbi:hypothetical protein [Xenorhabdus bovienii]
MRNKHSCSCPGFVHGVIPDRL